MPRRIPTPPRQAEHRPMSVLKQAAIARVVERLRVNPVGTGRDSVVPDTREERWWARKGSKLLAEQEAEHPRPLSDAVPADTLARLRAAAAAMPKRRAPKPHDDAERRWSREVTRLVRAGAAPAEAFAAADRIMKKEKHQ